MSELISQEELEQWKHPPANFHMHDKMAVAALPRLIAEVERLRAEENRCWALHTEEESRRYAAETRADQAEQQVKQLREALEKHVIVRGALHDECSVCGAIWLRDSKAEHKRTCPLSLPGGNDAQ